jgi:hypothetical protein
MIRYHRIESFEEERFTDRLVFTGPEGKDVAVGMVLANVEITAPYGLEPDCILPAESTSSFFRHGYVLMESFCRYICSVSWSRPCAGTAAPIKSRI